MHRLLVCGVIASAISFVGAHTAAAQAGSSGGSIGKQEKSVSGSAESEPSRPSKKPREERKKHSASTASSHGSGSGSGCRSIAGVWTSWASRLYGRNDTRIGADGTITHPSSKGTWTCSGGLYVHTWDAFGVRGPYKLSPDGRRLIKIQDGSISFSRS